MNQSISRQLLLENEWHVHMIIGWTLNQRDHLDACRKKWTTTHSGEESRKHVCRMLSCASPRERLSKQWGLLWRVSCVLVTTTAVLLTLNFPYPPRAHLSLSLEEGAQKATLLALPFKITSQGVRTSNQHEMKWLLVSERSCPPIFWKGFQDGPAVILVIQIRLEKIQDHLSKYSYGIPMCQNPKHS